MLDELQVIFDAKLTSLGNMAEGIFQSKPDITSSGETNDFGHGFFSQGGEEETEKTLVLKLPCHILRIRLRRRRIKAIVIGGGATEPSTWLRRF